MGLHILNKIKLDSMRFSFDGSFGLRDPFPQHVFTFSMTNFVFLRPIF